MKNLVKTAMSAALTVMVSTSAFAQGQSLVFSPFSLDIPAMKDLSSAIEHFSQEAGISYSSLDPKADPARQAQQLSQVIETGKVTGAWALAIRTSALRGVLQSAMKKRVAMVVSGRPEAYGMNGPQPGIAFSDINYSVYGGTLGAELAKCINEKSGGQAKVLFFGDSAANKAAELTDKAATTALANDAPKTQIVAKTDSRDRAESQQKTAQMLQANPDATAVYASNDENALGALKAFEVAGKKPVCVVAGGGAQEVRDGLKAGRIFAIVGFDFQGDAAQNFKTLQTLMQDPALPGPMLEIPVKVTK
ncbi:sugar ABC transporter substrate-binding protein [Allorhizobium undicola]|uniref:sugar ABC transporter substrate-binding protein n=1 Tax=Allorhizobium undicola TaxID=78527 RepID=UPI001378D099|nr:substrate-binding domain-containing protein [Allorhizobium undicola]